MTDNNIIELTPFRADLTRALARRGERLLASAELADEVEALQPLEAYYIIREIGLEQALPILLALSPEQLEACVDLDCWSRYDFAVDSLDEWLTAFSLAGPEVLARAFFSLDYVVQLLFLAQTVTVYDPDTDEIAQEDEESPLRAMTPDGFYLLQLKTELTLKIHPFTVLDALYQYDLRASHQLLSDVRVDLPTQIEEEALRFRNDRMQDIGFVPLDEAAVLFSPPDQRQPVSRPQRPVDSSPVRLPSVYAGSLIETSLLHKALSLITDQQFLTRLEQEIIWVINSAIIIYGEKTQETKQITDIAGRVRDTICLGLESLLNKECPDCRLAEAEAAGKALALLEKWYISDLFRHGFAAARSIQQEARKALTEPLFRVWYELAVVDQSDESIDRLARAFVAALLGHHPLHSGYDPALPEEVKAFTSLADIAAAQARLHGIIAHICHQA